MYFGYMSCTSPLYAWKTGRKTESGKDDYFITRTKFPPSIVAVNKYKQFDKPLKVGDPYTLQGKLADMVEIPCGHCAACRASYSRVWAERCMLEASAFDHNQYVTLSLAPEFYHEPNKEEITRFMKRLRNKLGSGIRFFGCGEIGGSGDLLTGGNPHYHLILFNCDLPDLRRFGSSSGYPTYVSDLISECWEHKGFCLIGSVTPESCAYVARYVVKKAMVSQQEGVFRPFIHMSRRPGIGYSFLDDHLAEIIDDQQVYAYFGPRKKTAYPPRYFSKLCEKNGVYLEYEKRRKRKLMEIHRQSELAGHHMTEDEYFEMLREKAKDKERRLERRRK